MDNKQAAISLGFGFVSTATTTTLTQPLDRIKTLRQQIGHGQEKSAWKLARMIVKERGLLELWKGTVPSVIRAAPGAALYLSLVDCLRTRLKVHDDDGKMLFITGFTTRLGIASLLQPFTMIKARLESSVYHDKSMWQASQTVVKELGVIGLWRGLLPTILRDAPYSGLYLVFYRRQVGLVEQWMGTPEIPTLTRFGCAVISGFVSCLITQPFDVVKTVVQLYPRKTASVYKAALLLYHDHGISFFFRGYLLRASRRTLAAALNWTIFDEIVCYIKKTFPHEEP